MGDMDYETFLETGKDGASYSLPLDEWDAIALSYTSGTTGNPKGVVTHHRGAYLNSMSNVIGWDMAHHPTYLWTLPFDMISRHDVTHLCGAPIVMSFIVNAKPEERSELKRKIFVMVAGAPPPPTIFQKMKEQGFDVTHVYGLTETYGPAVISPWKKEFNALDDSEQANLRSRQGVNYHVLEDLQVLDNETMEPVPADGETIGEVMFRGNVVMKGYLKNEKTTKKELADGWFHSGDLGVMYPDGYIQLKDRAKDIIISGGENISSIEIEAAVCAHPAVNLACAVARPDDKWGETPCVFVELHDGVGAPTEKEMITFCKERLAGYKVPRTFVFTKIPTTPTGKMQKFKLRDTAKAMGSLN